MLVSSNYAKNYASTISEKPTRLASFARWYCFRPELSLFTGMPFQGNTPVNVLILELGFQCL